MIKIDDKWYLIAIKYIANYNDTPDFIAKPNKGWSC